MFKGFYTTQMSASHKLLQTRFVKMRSGSGRFSKLMAAVMSVVLIFVMSCVTIVMAAVDNEPENFYINGKGYSISPVLIQNSFATHTDCYYVPLRDTFEALGYKVYYDVDKSKYNDLMGDESFPVYDSNPIIIRYDIQTNERIDIDMSTYYNWISSLVTNQVDTYIYGATGRLNYQMPIIEMEKDGNVEYCQIGAQETSSGLGYALAPVLIEGKAYIPLRAVANLVGDINGEECVKWDDNAHDTYFTGALTFDESSMTIHISLPE